MGEISNQEEQILSVLRKHIEQNEALTTLFAKMKDEIDSLIVLLMDFYASLPEDIKEELKHE